MRVLIIEDEVRLANNIASAFREGPRWAVDLAEDGIIGRDCHQQTDYDLIILDLMLPGLDGLGVLRSLRSKGRATPVLILTAVAERSSVVELLNAGADDYLAKPFDLGELLARAKALIRRAKGVSHPVISISQLVLDTIERTVSFNGKLIEFSITEYRVLEFLAHHPRSVISKQALVEHLYDYNWEHHSNVIEAHISNVRRKLSQAACDVWIETLRGRGYRLMAPSDVTVS